LQNGLLPIRLSKEHIDHIAAHANQGHIVSVDLDACVIRVAAAQSEIPFVIPAHQREALLNGWDDIDQSLALSQDIAAFQDRDKLLRPWIYDVENAVIAEHGARQI